MKSTQLVDKGRVGVEKIIDGRSINMKANIWGNGDRLTRLSSRLWKGRKVKGVYIIGFLSKHWSHNFEGIYKCLCKP